MCTYWLLLGVCRGTRNRGAGRVHHFLNSSRQFITGWGTLHTMLAVAYSNFSGLAMVDGFSALR